MNSNRTLTAHGATDRGRSRKNNEDALYVDTASGLIIVADGMGGQQAGEVAARMVVTDLPKHLAAGRAEGGQGQPRAAADTLRRSIALAGKAVWERSEQHAPLSGMGATVVAGLVADGWMAIGHLGDSRAYLLRHGVLERLTNDHTIAELLLAVGAITERVARDHFGRHALQKFVGLEDCPPADVGLLRLEPGDRLLLCTDGLTGMIDERTMGGVLLDTPDDETACRHLIDLANDAGGSDNITAVVATVPRDDDGKGPAPREELTVRRTVGESLVPPDAMPAPNTHELRDIR